MTWRAPNRLRAVRYRPPNRVSSAIHTVLGLLAGLMLLVLVILFLLLISPILSKAAQAEIKTPQACADLARSFKATPPLTLSREEANAVLAQLGFRMIAVSEARRCRAALKAELKK